MTKNDPESTVCRLWEFSDCSSGVRTGYIRSPGLESFSYGNVILRYYKCFVES